MNTSLPIRKASTLLAAPSLVRGAAIQLGVLLLAGILLLVTRQAAAFWLGPVAMAAQAVVGLGIGATLAGAAAIAVLATPWGKSLELYPRRLPSGWADLLASGLLAGLSATLLFQVALQPLVGVCAAAALFALVEGLVGGFRLFRGVQLGSSLIALALGLVAGGLYASFGLVAVLIAQIGFRMIFLMIVRPAYAPGL